MTRSLLWSTFSSPQRTLRECVWRAGVALSVLACLSLLNACSSLPAHAPGSAPSATSGKGGYYLDDGPGANPPAHLEQIPDAVPRREALNRHANKPYTAFGKVYVPDMSNKPYKARGLASWYGRRYHQQKTSTGEIYDMYGMTGAHPTLPLPCYVRVTNLSNQRSVVIRINDRGPFRNDRLIDLSYTAAWKLGLVGHGSAEVEVERVFPP